MIYAIAIIGLTALAAALVVACIGLAFWYTITGRRDNQGKPVSWH